MKNPEIQRLYKRKITGESDSKEHSRNSFYHKGNIQNPLGKSDKPFHGKDIQALSHNKPFCKSYALSGNKVDYTCGCHISKSADLHKQHYDYLSKDREVHRGVLNNQTCNTDR